MEPTFDDDTGEARTDAARALVERFTEGVVDVQTDVALARVPEIVIDRGRHKHVLVELRAANGETRVVLRATAHCAYHANVAAALERECRELGVACALRVLGGGRIERADVGDEDGPRVFVFGYSKTFGRAPGCNERAAEMVRRCGAFEGYRVSWSDDGY